MVKKDALLHDDMAVDQTLPRESDASLGGGNVLQVVQESSGWIRFAPATVCWFMYVR